MFEKDYIGSTVVGPRGIRTTSASNSEWQRRSTPTFIAPLGVVCFPLIRTGSTRIRVVVQIAKGHAVQIGTYCTGEKKRVPSARYVAREWQ